ncbi:MAG: hypothetical protein EOL88_14945 [Bacteroidia bacterium]|nr:hypothetical protein [Bacteroidia bacterium]
MIELTKEQINFAIVQVEDGLKKYIALQEMLQVVDVSSDRQFQKQFNHFYRVRRNAEWQSHFYELLQKNKKIGVSFHDAITAIYEKTGRLEASFASKLVATIHPDRPVIDKFVLENAKLKLPSPSSKDREGKIVLVYNQLRDKFATFMKTESGEYLVKEFGTKFPQAAITKIKMVDLVLWQTRGVA